MRYRRSKSQIDKIPISEADLQISIIHLARVLGYRVAHFRPAMKADGSWVTPVTADGKGFPDLVLVHKEKKRVLFIETKSEKGKCSPEQEEWLDILAGCAETYLIRPSEWEYIKEILMLDSAPTENNERLRAVME